VSVIDNLIKRMQGLWVGTPTPTPSSVTPTPVAPQKIDFSNVRSLPMTLYVPPKPIVEPVPQFQPMQRETPSISSLLKLPARTPQAVQWNSVLDTIGVKSEDQIRREAQERSNQDQFALDMQTARRFGSDKEFDANSLMTPMLQPKTAEDFRRESEQSFRDYGNRVLWDIENVTEKLSERGLGFLWPALLPITAVGSAIKNIDWQTVWNAFIDPKWTFNPTVDPEKQRTEYTNALKRIQAVTPNLERAKSNVAQAVQNSVNSLVLQSDSPQAVKNYQQLSNQIIWQQNMIIPVVQALELDAKQFEDNGQVAKAQAIRNAYNTYIESVPRRQVEIANLTSEFMQIDINNWWNGSYSKALSQALKELVYDNGFRSLDDYVSQDLIDLDGNKFVKDIEVYWPNGVEVVKTKETTQMLNSTDILNYLQIQSAVWIDRDYWGRNPARVLMNEVNRVTMPIQASIANNVAIWMETFWLNPLSANDLWWMSELNTADVDMGEWKRTTGRFVDQLTDYAPETIAILPQVLMWWGMQTASVMQWFRATNVAKNASTARIVWSNIVPMLRAVWFNASKFVWWEIWINSAIDSQAQLPTDLMSANANALWFAIWTVIDLAVPAYRFANSLWEGSNALVRNHQEMAYVAKQFEPWMTIDQVAEIQKTARSLPASELPSVPYNPRQAMETMRATEWYVRATQQDLISRITKLQENAKTITDPKKLMSTNRRIKTLTDQLRNFNKHVKTWMLWQELLRDLASGVQLSPKRQEEIAQMLRLADNSKAGIQDMMNFIKNQDTRQQSELFQSSYFNEKSQRELSTTDSRTLLNMFELRTGLSADKTFTLKELEDANIKWWIFEWLWTMEKGKYKYITQTPWEDTFRLNPEWLQKLNASVENVNVADVRNADAPAEKIKELFEWDDAYAKVKPDVRDRIVDTDVVDNYIEEINKFIPCIT